MLVIPWWLFGLILGWAFFATLVLVRSRLNQPPLFVDRGSWIFNCPNERAQRSVVECVARFGETALFRLDTSLVKRALLSRGTVIAVTDKKLLEKMNGAGAGLALIVQDPAAAAREVRDFLVSRGFASRILGELDPEVPSGVTFLASEAFEGWVMIFRRKVPSSWSPPAWR